MIDDGQTSLSRRRPVGNIRHPAPAMVLGCVLSLGLLMTGGCASVASSRGFGTAALHGIVFDGSGAPLAWVTIEVERATAVQSDINGRFVVPGVRRGPVRVAAEKDGYEAVITEVEFVNRTQVLYVRMHSAEDLVRAAGQALRDKRLRAAVAYANRALAVDRESASAHYAAACAYLLSGMPREALRFLTAGWPTLVKRENGEISGEVIYDQGTIHAVRLLLARARAAVNDSPPAPTAPTDGS